MKLLLKVVLVIALVALPSTVFAACANHCSGHGDCDTNHQVKCTCQRGWAGADCSLRECPSGKAWSDLSTAIDTAHAEHTTCSNRGLCDYKTGTCQCQDGFEGKACERMTCFNDCSGHGVCRSMRRSAELQFTSVEQYKYVAVWDADMVYGCDCDLGWEGADCSLRTCVASDDPMTTAQVNEKQLILCTATSGWFTVELDGKISKRINFDDNEDAVKNAIEPYITEVHVVFESGESTVCSSFGAVTSIEFASRSGDVPALTLRPDYANNLNSGGTIVIRDGQTSSNDLEHSGTTYTAVQGTKEYEYCAGRGFCNQEEGDCMCYTGYGSSNFRGFLGISGDCGFPLTPITACPGETECSGHGNCADHPTYRCSCEEGWQGGDCSERTCPFDMAWFDHPTANNVAHDSMECSNRGLCDRSTGKCVCSPGFTGTACERMLCPGEPTNTCSGNGRCMSMAQLAEISDVNGDSAAFTYGASPRDNLHWDFNKVYGCYCDEGWHGYDCSLRDCPRGDDPKTDGVKEIQLMKCTAASGTFVLSFRQDLTASLSTSITAAELKAALEDLDTINGVSVVYSGAVDDSTALCQPDGSNVAIITFDQDFGDLPNLILEDNSVAPGEVDLDVAAASYSDLTNTYNAQDGTKENNYCSDRGVCNESTGICECFTQYGSSNGDNTPGTRGDCGYVLPIIPVDKVANDLALFLAREQQFGEEAAPDLNF